MNHNAKESREFICNGFICFEKDVQTKKERIVKGYASVEVRDVDNDIFLIDGLKKAMDNYQKRGALLFYDHKIPCGNVISYTFTTTFVPQGKDGNQKEVPALFIEAQVWNMNEKFDDFVWSEVVEGRITGFSIRGFINNYRIEYDPSTGTKVRIIDDVDLREISLVYQPANPLALISEVQKRNELRTLLQDERSALSIVELQKRINLIETFIKEEQQQIEDEQEQGQGQVQEQRERQRENVSYDLDYYVDHLMQLLNILQKKNRDKSKEMRRKVAACMREKDREGWNLKNEKERKQALAICYNMARKGLQDSDVMKHLISADWFIELFGITKEQVDEKMNNLSLSIGAGVEMAKSLLDLNKITDQNAIQELKKWIVIEDIHVDKYKANLMNYYIEYDNLSNLGRWLNKHGQPAEAQTVNRFLSELQYALELAKQGKGDRLLHDLHLSIVRFGSELRRRYSYWAYAHMPSFNYLQEIALAVRGIKFARKKALYIIYKYGLLDNKTAQVILEAPYNTSILMQVLQEPGKLEKTLWEDYAYWTPEKEERYEQGQNKENSTFQKALSLSEDVIDKLHTLLIMERKWTSGYRDALMLAYSMLNDLKRIRYDLSRYGKAIYVHKLDLVIEKIYEIMPRVQKGDVRAANDFLKMYNLLFKEFEQANIYLPSLHTLRLLAEYAMNILAIRVEAYRLLQDHVPNIDSYINEDEFYSFSLTDSVLDMLFSYISYPPLLESGKVLGEEDEYNKSMHKNAGRSAVVSYHMFKKYALQRRLFRKELVQRTAEEKEQLRDYLVDKLMTIEENMLEYAIQPYNRAGIHIEKWIEQLYDLQNLAAILLERDEPYMTLREFIVIYHLFSENEEIKPEVLNALKNIAERVQAGLFTVMSPADVLNNLAHFAHVLALHLAEISFTEESEKHG